MSEDDLRGSVNENFGSQPLATGAAMKILSGHRNEALIYLKAHMHGAGDGFVHICPFGEPLTPDAKAAKDREIAVRAIKKIMRDGGITIDQLISG